MGSMKNVILIALAVLFNEFIGAALVLVASVLIKVGHIISQIPEIF